MPTIVGATVLELSKAFMFRFHYQRMKSVFSCQLLYSDTDSFIYEIEHEDVYERLAADDMRLLFDFSNYPSGHPLHSQANKKVVLKFKDEMAGEVIEEVCALKAKTYSIRLKSMLIKS